MPKEEQILEKITKEIEKHPNSAHLYMERANIYYDWEDENAIQDYSKVIELEPNNTEAYFKRGVLVMWFKDNKSSAIDDFSEVIKSNPDNAITYAYRGYCKWWSGYTDFIEDFVKALELEPENEKIYEEIDAIVPREQFFVWGSYLKRNPDNIAGYEQEIYSLNEYCSDSGFDNEDIVYCRERLYHSNNIDFGEHHAKISEIKNHCFDLLKQYEEEEKEEEKQSKLFAKSNKDYYIESLNDFDESNYLDKGNTCYQLGRYDEASDFYDKYIKMSLTYYEKEIDVYFKNGYCYYKLQDYQKAIENYNHFIELSNRNTSSKGYLYRGLVYLDQKDYKHAVADFKKAYQYLSDEKEESELALEIDLARNFAKILSEA